MYLAMIFQFLSYNNTLNATKKSAQAVKTVGSGGLVHFGRINTIRHVSFYLVLSTSAIKVKEPNFLSDHYNTGYRAPFLWEVLVQWYSLR